MYFHYHLLPIIISIEFCFDFCFCFCFDSLPREFALDFIEKLKGQAEVHPNAGRRVGAGNVIKLGSDCTGLGSDFVALKLALGKSGVVLKTAFISDT